jgi:Phospholipase/Carboxylesterase
MMIPESLIYTDEYFRVRALPTQHTSTYIFCHGKSQTGEQWQFLVQPLRKLGHVDHVAFIFPYFDFSEGITESQLLSAASLVQKIVLDEIEKGIPAHRIAVGGINEGFEIGLLATVAGSAKIAGTVGVSKGLEYSHNIVEHKKTVNADPPVFVIVRSGETRSRTGDGILESIGQPLGRLVYETEHLGTQDQTISSKVFYPKKAFESHFLISCRT